MKKLLVVLLLSLPLFSDSLQLQSGSIAAHTEMMMDSTIDPLSSKLSSEISMQDSNIISLNGKFWVQMSSFVSDKKDRDEHMQKALDSNKYKLATYTITSVVPTSQADIYTLKGKLAFHGVEKELSAKAKITTDDKVVNFKANTMINMKDFGVEMPCMVFMCVRDQVDLVVTASFIK